MRYFAAAAEAAGRDEERMAAATVGELRAALADRYGEPMQRILDRGSFLVDGVVTRDAARPVSPRVDVLPPFSGG